MAPINNKNPFNVTKKPTGTVPKIASTGLQRTFNTHKASSSTSVSTKNAPPSLSRKNTEIVAPTRRELNDLNNYLLAVTTSDTTKHQHNNCSSTSATGGTNNLGHQIDSTCFEIDNSQENQRYCYPVRPIPRRNILNKKHHTQETNLTTTVSPSANLQSTNITTNSSAAAVGVVIPTTPGCNSIVPQSNILPTSSTIELNINNQPQAFDVNSDLNWEERLNFIQYFLSLTAKSNSKASDNRAHSVSSIQTNLSNDQPTSNYDELQHCLEHSNRNIQNIKEQQQQLLQLQQAAKQHLTDMEDVRNRIPIRSETNNGQIPEYESVEAVHNDMSNLVSRMKNLQLFIQNQNQLSALLGDDSPDILAEQELLQKKLNELKMHRSEMKTLVNELQEINQNAERNIQNNSENENDDHDQTSAGAGANRIVPIEYQRVVPVELIPSTRKTITNGQYNNVLVNSRTHETTPNIDNDENNEDQIDAETANMIQQKVNDINAMKNQLQRLKDMMATVKLIEDKTEDKLPAANINDNATELPREEILTSNRRPVEIPISMQREFSKNFNKILGEPIEPLSNTNTPKNAAILVEEQAMSERVRLLHEMTADLREQAVSLTTERDRLKEIKDEMKRRNNNANQLNKNSNIGSDNSQRNNINNNQGSVKVDSEKDLLKAEYEAKKKEFEKICQRLQSEEDNPDRNISNHHSNNENDDDTEDADDDLKQDSTSANYYTENWHDQQEQQPQEDQTCERPVNLTSCNSSVHEKTTDSANIQNRGKDSADSGAADVNGITSIEAGSVQSGSSRSYSMPPPMRTIIVNGAAGSVGNNRDTSWRKNSQDHSNAGGTNNQQQYMDHSFVTMPPTWNAYYYNPYSPHFSYHQPSYPSQAAGAAGSEFICSHSSFYGNNNGFPNNTTNSGSQNNINDPVLLQQFIQTQQMLINSVCQCNQLLWHQQREINNLNSIVVLLQERLISTASETNSSESIPVTMPNNTPNVFGTPQRAQSEQPLYRPPTFCMQQQYQPAYAPISPHRYQYHNGYNYGNYAQHIFYHQNNQQRRQNLQYTSSTGSVSGVIPSNSDYTFVNMAEQQIQPNENAQQIPTYPPRQTSPLRNSNVRPTTNTSTATTTIIPQQNFLNNADTMNIQSPPAASGVPPPIFMNHHNNNIGGIDNQPPTHLNNNLNNNNANLLNTNQNQNHNTTNNNTIGSALNNQVPPGNRANNYWDNFRSYSRQNLLSSNSCKSNEEHNQHQQQQIQQLHQQQQHISQQQQTPFNSSNSANIYQQNSNISAIPQINNTNHNNNNNNTLNMSNNLNPQNYNKYFNTSRNVVGNQQQQLTNQINVNNDTDNLPTVNRDQTLSMILTNIQTQQHLEVNQGGSASSNLSNNQSDNLNLNENLFDFNNTNNNTSNLSNCNNNDTHNRRLNDEISNSITNNNNNNIAAIFGSPDFRNMNFNFGVNEQKKLPTKTTSCSNTKRLRHTQSLQGINNNSNQNLHFNENDTNTNNNNNISNRVTDGIENLNQNNILNYNQQQHGNNNTYNDHSNIVEDIVEGAGSVDETSEEIKKNLLVNALKNDKFSSKFFETLKEDVYRQAYAILQEKKFDQQFLAQLFDELKRSPTCDPLRNLLTQSNNNKKQIQLNTNRSFNDTESNDGDNEMENYEQNVNDNNLLNNLISSQTPTIHSGYENIDNSIWSVITANQNVSIEHNNTETNESCIENAHNTDDMNTKDMKMLAYKFMMCNNNSIVDQQNHKNKFQEKNCDIHQSGNEGQPLNDEARALPIPISGTTTSYRPDIYIVNYVMRRIRKELLSNCVIDDPIILRIAKTTITMLQDAILILGGQNKSLKIDHLQITSKEMYMKMKKFNKRDHEHFLADYQNYLMHIINKNSNINSTKQSSSRQFQQYSNEQTDLMNRSTTNNINFSPYRHCDNIGEEFKSNIPQCSDEIKVENVIENHQQQRGMTINSNSTAQHDIGSPCSNSNNNIINEDLAEADQICSSNTNSNNILLGNSSGNNFTLSIGNNSSNRIGEQINSNEIPQRIHSLEIEFFEHDILGDNASMNEEDQDDAEEAAAAAAAIDETLNVESLNSRNQMNRIYSNSINSMETENNENLLDDQQKHQQHFKVHSNSSNITNTDCCIGSIGGNTSGAYALVYPINNNLIESHDNPITTVHNNNFDNVTRAMQQRQSDSNCSSPSSFTTTTKKSIIKTNKRNSVP